jgi:hypothetical protein
MQPEFGVGLESYANDIASSGPGVFFTFGAGQNSAGVWMPQLWKSVDDGETWSNEELPLPLGVESGEVTECEHEVGHWLGAGYGVTTSGRQVPLLWDLDTSVPTAPWVVHELPLPAGDEGGQNASVHKLPGRTKYANIVLKSGLSPEVGVWVDDAAGGWTLFGPADYLLNPGIGTPVASGGIDRYGRIAVKFVPPPPTANPVAPMQTGDTAGILIPSPATGIEERRTAPRLIALSVSPNPFQSGVRIGYTLPWDASATVTVHDVTGAVVATLDRGRLAAGRERVVRWNGIARGGGRAASGVYFVRVETSYEVSTAKIVSIQ